MTLNFSRAAPLQQWLKTDWRDLLLMMFLGLFGLWMGTEAGIIIADDAMITFRVAENLASGQGFVFNVGERVQVTTTPLYAIILAGGAWIFGSAPQAALILNIALAALIPVLAYNLGRRLSGRITGVAGGLLLAVMPLLVIAFSMESYLYVALILASMGTYVARRYTLAGVVIGFTTMLRGDAVLLGACLLTFDFLARRRLRWRLILPAITIPALWYLFATVYYGSPFPATLQAKTAQGEFNWLGEYFISGFIEYWEDWVEDFSGYFYIFPLFYILGLIPVLRRERLWLILVARDALYVAAFEGLGVTFAEWYYAPLTPGVALIIGRGVQFVAEGAARLFSQILPKQKAAQIYGAIAALIAAAITLFMLQTVYPVTRSIINQNPDWKALAYPPAARWIVENTNASATLATIDIGHLGYWSKRHIVDIVGLAQPDVAAHIAQGDFGYAIRQYQPDIVLLGETWLPEIQSTDWFQQDYPVRRRLHLDGRDEPLTLFSRREGVKAQPEAIPAAAIQPASVDFNRQITLTGYTFGNRRISPGDTLNLTLFWQAEAPIDLDFTVFVQLVDQNNNIVAQGDGKPQQGFYTTNYWQPGEQINDGYSIAIGPDVSPGNYALLVGLYEAGSGARLQILNENGQFSSDHFKIPNVEIEKPPEG